MKLKRYSRSQSQWGESHIQELRALEQIEWDTQHRDEFGRRFPFGGLLLIRAISGLRVGIVSLLRREGLRRMGGRVDKLYGSTFFHPLRRFGRLEGGLKTPILMSSREAHFLLHSVLHALHLLSFPLLHRLVTDAFFLVLRLLWIHWAEFPILEICPKTCQKKRKWIFTDVKIVAEK